MTQEQKTRVRELRSGGMGYGSIARTTGISESTIRSFCRRPAAKAAAEPEIHRCLYCGVPVAQTPGRREKKFCSDKCRAKWWNAHHDQENRTSMRTVVCANCGKDFEVYGSVPRKYCCHACYIRHRFGGGV